MLLHLQCTLYTHTLHSSVLVHICLQEIQIRLLQCLNINTELLPLILPITVLELNLTYYILENIFLFSPLLSGHLFPFLCSLACFPLSFSLSLLSSFHSLPSFSSLFLQVSYMYTVFPDINTRLGREGRNEGWRMERGNRRFGCVGLPSFPCRKFNFTYIFFFIFCLLFSTSVKHLAFCFCDFIVFLKPYYLFGSFFFLSQNEMSFFWSILPVKNIFVFVLLLNTAHGWGR